MTTVATVKFMPMEAVEEVRAGESVFDVGARVEGVKIETACVGKGTCGLCRVVVLAGEKFLSPYTDAELEHLGNMYFVTKMRLSCRMQVQGGDVVVMPKPGRQKRSRK